MRLETSLVLALVVGAALSWEPAARNTSALLLRMMDNDDDSDTKYRWILQTGPRKQSPSPLLTSMANLYGPSGSEASALLAARDATADVELASTYSTFSVSTIDVEEVEQRLRVSMVLRDNLITVFGYLLHLPANPLPEDMYFSLYQLQVALRLRRLPTAGLLRSLWRLSGLRPLDQMRFLFQHLSLAAPRYLVTAVRVWRIGLGRRRVDIDAIVRPGGGALVVDILAGIPAAYLLTLRRELAVTPGVASRTLLRLRLRLGSEMAKTLTALAEGDVSLTPKLFAVVLAHRPRDAVLPQKDEFERYLVDYLWTYGLDNWDEVVHRPPLNGAIMHDIVIMTDVVLRRLSGHPSVDKSLRHAARIVQSYVYEPSATFVNEYYSVDSQVLNSPILDIRNLLRAITEQEYPPYVVQLKNRFLYYVGNRYIDMEKASKGFNRFDYIKPIELLIALLTRIVVRQKDLPREVYQTVNSLQLFLVFKALLFKFPTQLPPDFIEMETLAAEFGGPELTPACVKVRQRLVAAMERSRVPWGTLIQDTGIEQCSHPRQCFLHLAREAMARGLLREAEGLREPLEKLMTHCGSDGRTPHSDAAERSSTVIEILPAKDTIVSFTPAKPKEFCPYGPVDNKTRQHCEPHWLQPGARRWRYVPLPGEQSLPPGTPFPAVSALFDEEPASPTTPELLLPPARPGSPQHLRLRRLRMLLMEPHLYSFLAGRFDPHRHKKKGPFLRELLHRLLEVEFVQADPVLVQLIRDYLAHLNRTGAKLARRQTRITVNFDALLNALGPPRSHKELAMYGTLREFLAHGNLTDLANLTVKAKKCKTSGELMRHVLKASLNLPSVQKNKALRQAIEFFSDRVLLNGYGASAIEFIQVKNTTRLTSEIAVDLKEVFRALDVENMTAKARDAALLVANTLHKSFRPEVHLRDFQYKKYRTTGQLLLNAFRHILDHRTVTKPEVIEAIQTLVPLVRLDGPGAKPVEFL